MPPLPSQVTVRFVNSLVGVITSEIDSIHGSDMHPSSKSSPGLIDGVHSPEMIHQHFKNTLIYIQCASSCACSLTGCGKLTPPSSLSAARKAAHSSDGGAADNGDDSPAAPAWDTVDVVGACAAAALPSLPELSSSAAC